MLDKESLLADGWQEFSEDAAIADHSFSKRVDGYPVCRTNENLWIILRHWDYRRYDIDCDSFEVEIRAQTIHDDWVILKFYGISDQSEIPEKCDRMLNSWVAAND